MGLIFQVPQSHCVIIERFGKYARTVEAGLHFRLPFIERQKNVIADCGWILDNGPVACKKHGGYTYIELADQRINTAPRVYHTSDNVEVKIDAVIFWRIVEPRNAVYAVDNLIVSLIDLSLNSMRSNIGQMTLDQLLSNRQQLNESTARAVSGTAQKWGISIQRVEIQELATDQMTTDTMRKEMEAERNRRAAILEAEGASKATVLQAEADKKAMILRAEGEAEAQKLRAQADASYLAALKGAIGDSPEVIKVLMMQKYTEGFSEISKNPSDKVFLPNSIDGIRLFMQDRER